MTDAQLPELLAATQPLAMAYRMLNPRRVEGASGMRRACGKHGDSDNGGAEIRVAGESGAGSRNGWSKFTRKCSGGDPGGGAT